MLAALLAAALVTTLPPAVPPAAPDSKSAVLVVVGQGPERPVLEASFGMNGLEGLDLAPVRRHGGNRFSTFNWETGASNAGSDWNHHSDGLMRPLPHLTGEGDVLRHLLERDARRGARSVLTVPLLGWVAADTEGVVADHEAAPSRRWLPMDLAGATAGAPAAGGDRGDGVVRLAEMVAHLQGGKGPVGDDSPEGSVAPSAPATTPVPLAFCLGNEPALWPHTHPRVHPTPPTWGEVLERGVAAARTVTAHDPQVEIWGPVLYGWAAHHDLQGAVDADDHRTGGWLGDVFGHDEDAVRTFTDFYLAGMSRASRDTGRRLLHRFDVHWYPESRGAERVIGGARDAATVSARLQAPRSLWDPDYVEPSWVSGAAGGAVRLLPRLQEAVDRHFPGTGLAVSEYHFGAPDHVSGGLAQVDALGVFARHGVAACYWPLGDDQSYVEAAFRLYLDPAGEGRAFGDVSLAAVSGDAERLAVHAARRGADGALTLVLVNKDEQPLTALLDGLEGRPVLASFRLDGEAPRVLEVTAPALPDARLPPRSATLLVLGAVATR